MGHYCAKTKSCGSRLNESGSMRIGPHKRPGFKIKHVGVNRILRFFVWWCRVFIYLGLVCTCPNYRELLPFPGLATTYARWSHMHVVSPLVPGVMTLGGDGGVRLYHPLLTMFVYNSLQFDTVSTFVLFPS